MHEHDQELIMALADGTLETTAAVAAEAALAGCDECLRDLELQRVAIEALDNAPAVYLSATESAQLHETLKDELSMIPPAPVTRSSNVAWGRWAGLAMGAAAMFLGAVLVLPALFGGGDDADTVAFDEIGEAVQDPAAIQSATTAAASATTSAPASAFEDPLAGADAASESAGGDDMAAAATTTDAPAVSPIPAYEIEGDLTEELRVEIIDQLRVNSATFTLSDQAAKNTAPGLDLCIEELVDDAIPDNAEPQIIGTVIGVDGQERLLVIYVTPNLEDTVVVALELPGCEVYQTVP